MSEHMNPTETEQEKTYAQQRAELSGSFYGILFLVVTTYVLDRAFAAYLDRLVHVSQISRWTFLVQYVDSGTGDVSGEATLRELVDESFEIKTSHQISFWH